MQLPVSPLPKKSKHSLEGFLKEKVNIFCRVALNSKFKTFEIFILTISVSNKAFNKIPII